MVSIRFASIMMTMKWIVLFPSWSSHIIVYAYPMNNIPSSSSSTPSTNGASKASGATTSTTTSQSTKRTSLLLPPFHRYRSIHNNSIVNQIKIGYQQRVQADPTFLHKSMIEVILAAGTQFTAEYVKRGRSLQQILTEGDFVIPAIVTAICGKYYRYDNNILPSI
jgi:hypothetical protein